MLAPVVLTLLVAHPFFAVPLAGQTRSSQQPPASPGTKDGVAVPVLVEVEMTFTIRKKS
jgi:hypothetical protein